MSTPTTLDPALHGADQRLQLRIEGLRRQVRRHLTLTALSQATVVILGVALVSLLLDYFFRLSYVTRLVQFVLFGGGVAWFLVTWVYGRLLRSLPDDELALAVERGYPELDCRLVGAVQFMAAPPEESRLARSIAAAVIEQADFETRALDFGAIVDWRRLRDRLLQGAGAVLIAALVSYNFTVVDLSSREDRLAVGIWLQRNVLLMPSVEWPKSTQLRPITKGLGEGRIVVEAGASLDIIVEAWGVLPRKVFIEWHSESEELSELERPLYEGTAVLAKVGDNEFRHSFPTVRESFVLRVWGGDDEIGPVEVYVVKPPWVRSLSIAADFPEHTGRQDRVFETGAGDLAIPEGTELTIKGESSKSLQKAWVTLRAPGEPKIALWDEDMALSGTRGFGIALVVTQTLVATIDVLDKDELSTESPPRLTFRAILDRAPKLTIATRGVGNMITPQARVPLTLRARDDYGLTWGALSFRYSNPDPKLEGGDGELVLEEFRRGRQAEALPTWEIESIKLKPNTFLNFWAEAIDNDGLRPPKKGRSQVMTVRIVTREELMNDMIRRQQEQRREFEALIRIEREIYQATRAAVPEAKELFKEARRQLRIARRSGTIRNAVAQIVEEMGNNKILEEEDLVRLMRNIVEPLRVLNEEELPRSRRSLEELAGKRDDKVLHRRVLEEIEAIIALMEQIKNQMLRLETLTELITRLEGIIQLWDEVLDETKGKAGGQ